MERNPQAAQMADESMVRNLLAQAEAIWPQERALVAAYGTPARVLDVGCGTGEITARLAETFPHATVEGLDLEEPHLVRARERAARFGSRVTFRRGDAFALDVPTASVDLVVCRHVIQAVPEPQRVLAELVRVAAPGGRVHVVAEDYGLMHFHPTRRDADEFWRRGAFAYGEAIGVDLRVGRKAVPMLAALGLRDIRCDYGIVDTLRVRRPTFAAIWEAWRDGYTDVLADKTSLTRGEILAHFEDMIACIRDPQGYAVWHVPVVSGVK